MSSWLPPLAKLVGLVVVLPFAATYLHLHHRARRNEYCFVGPRVSLVSGRPYDSAVGNDGAGTSAAIVGGAGADNRLRGEATTKKAKWRDDAGFARFHGIYAPVTPKRKKKDNTNLDRRQFQQIHSSATVKSSAWLRARGWPSATQSSAAASPRRDPGGSADRAISFAEGDGGGRWCLRSTDGGGWCSDPLPDYPEGTIRAYPPGGIWQPVSSSSKSFLALEIACPAPAALPKKVSTGKGKFRNKKQNENLRFLLDHPATVLLMALNVGLAFHYWNHRISPAIVCKQYSKIVGEHEWWRGLTGATAHFEPLHIGFNMMSLHTLGRELEGGFGSIVFLVYNIALVVFTTAVMMGMVYARLRWTQRELDRTSNPQLQASYEGQIMRLRETSSVGFSGVLFAWMVVSTLERTQATCPIPFFSDVCFSTYSVPGMPFLKFNISPIVSLFVAQFIMPRVSFMGHLAGIVCGFCLHWGWAVPPLEACSPNVLIGGTFLLLLVWRRRIIPVRPLLTAMLDEEGGAEHEDYLRSVLADGRAGEGGGLDGATTSNGNDSDSATDPFVRSKQKKKERERREFLRKQRTLRTVRNSMALVTLASLFAFSWNSSLVLSQCLLLAYFTYGTQGSLIVWAYVRSKEAPDIVEPERKRSGTIWRGFFLSAVLAVVVDAMSAASWFVFPTLVAAERPSLPLGLLPVTGFMMMRIAINLIALVLSSKILHDTSQVGGGIFVGVFSAAIRWTKLIGDGAFASQKPLSSAFEGRGITLGTRGR